MISFPNAKINIGLHVLKKRIDGFHNIETILYPVLLHDVLEIRENKQFNVSYFGLELPDGTDQNICVKAYQLLKKEFELPPVEICLYKNIPVGAGLGGGSANAAFMLKMLNDYFKLNLSLGKLSGYAGKLGSDCSFFIKNHPSYATSTGTQLEDISLDLSIYKIVILSPNIFSNTHWAYQNIVPKSQEKSLKKYALLPVEQWKENITNDFEQIIFKKFPQLAHFKSLLYDLGAVYASMSGSGSSLYGIFETSFTENEIVRAINEEDVSVFISNSGTNTP